MLNETAVDGVFLRLLGHYIYLSQQSLSTRAFIIAGTPECRFLKASEMALKRWRDNEEQLLLLRRT